MKDRKEDEIISFGQKRRTFLKTAGVGVLATALIAAGCKKKTMIHHQVMGRST